METRLARAALVYVSAIFVGLMFTGVSSALDPETIAGAWLLDEGKGKVAKDFSKNGNDGEILGNPKWVEGVFGKALEFDGADDHINCGNGKSLDLTESFTLMAWGKYTTSASIDFMNHTGCWGYFLATWENKINFPQQCDAASSIGKNLNDGKWHHVAGTYDGEKVILYYDGELHIEKNYTPAQAFTNPGNLHIGCAGDRLDELFVGTIDEVAVFNVALPADDIKKIATKGLAGALAVSPKEKLTAIWGKIKAGN